YLLIYYQLSDVTIKKKLNPSSVQTGHFQQAAPYGRRVALPCMCRGRTCGMQNTKKVRDGKVGKGEKQRILRENAVVSCAKIP
ncbi:MAG: hypothetical protein ACI4QT_03665, partial [Kiritimatiellia bacterium]